MYVYNIHPSKLHIDFWIVHSLFLTEYLVLSGDIIVKSIIQKATEMLNACQKMPEKLWAWHSYNVILTVVLQPFFMKITEGGRHSFF
jgi:hypothetical protein